MILRLTGCAERQIAGHRVAFACRSCNDRAMTAAGASGNPQPPAAYVEHVAGPREVDDALDLAIDRTIDAQDDFEKLPAADPKALPKADVVVRRAEDVKTLANEADKPDAD